MKRPLKGISLTRKFLLFFVLILALSAADYHLFLGKSRKVEVYDDLISRLSSIRISMTKLEYLLDMFVVARRFEVTTVNLIKSDVETLDLSLNELFSSQKYVGIVKSDNLLSEGLTSIADDWRLIKEEISRLNTANTQDEVMLIHNAVDLHTIIITEKAERLISVTNENRAKKFFEFKTIAWASIAGNILFFLVLSLVIHKTVVVPLRKTADSAATVSSGWPELRFNRAGTDLVWRMVGELNRMLESIAGRYHEKEEERNSIASKLADKMGQMEVLRAVSASASTTLSQSVIFNGAVKEAQHSGRADCAGVMILEEGVLMLKAQSGFDDNFSKEFSPMDPALIGLESKGSEWKEGLRSSILFNSPDDLPEGKFGDYLRGAGFSSVLIVPIVYDSSVKGYLIALFKEDAAQQVNDNRSFFEAVALTIGTLNGYINIIQEEHDAKKFLERMIYQMPFGVAVFDLEGRCVLSNSVLKRLLGVPGHFDFAASYRLMEDEVFTEQGLLNSIQKTYEGYTTEFIINYTPSRLTKYDFEGPSRRLKIKSFPLYGSGGEIAEIVLLYDDLTDKEEEHARSGEIV